jgi:uncharacterized phiE125 gp8 family phage protein
MPDRLVTPASANAVTLELAKKHLVIEHAADDDLITQIVTAANDFAERYCNRGFVEQTWEVLFPAFPVANPCADVYLELRRGKLLEVDSFKYVDEAGAEQTLSADTYLVDDASDPGRIRLAPDATWPTIQARWDAVRIQYTCGWVEGSVPAPIVQAVLLLISQLYENRTPEVTGTIVASIKFSFEALLSTYRIHAV